MDRNTFTGLFLIMIILVAGFYIIRPSADDIKKAQETAHADSVKKGLIKTPGDAVKTNQTAKADTNQTIDSAVLKTPFGAATIGKQNIVVLENSDIKVNLNTLGGKVQAVELKNYKTFDKKPLVLFDGDGNKFGFSFAAANKDINTNNLYFTQVATSDTSITLRLTYTPQQYIDYVYTLPANGFKLGLTVKATGLDNIIANSKSLNLQWAASLHKQEKDMKQEREFSTVYYKYANDNVEHLTVNGDEQKDATDKEKKVQWISFKQHFFSSVLIAKNGVEKTNVEVKTDVNSLTDVKNMTANVTLMRDAGGAIPLEFYFGPNQFSILKKQGYDLQDQVDMGWGPLKYINRFVVLPVFNFLNQFNWNYGIIILVLTILLKLVLSPLTYKSYLSMAKMRVLKPEMDEIKAKVGEENPTLLQQEYLKLYKKAGVNPLGGCLPLVLQMPIVIAFFRFFPSLFELRGESFLWMKDLSTYDAVITWGSTIPVFGNHISLMCLLMTISTLIYTYFNNQVSGATGQMKYIGYITPLIFFGMLNSYPAGLNYYYFLANMLTFGQQYLIRLMVDDKKIHAKIQENKQKPEDPKKKKSGFAAKMEEMMRQQQQAQQGKKK
ncbi:membrane protein insertase YidC [Mucilaginibacter limnophilus]|uniref:Membrane protein insertase YidC n=1 Tax=Mucilaginibacter limnophilus TaxID=1932778 RepID=A0A437MKD2_9SPHI|nr:membrane protein insertase YidC [Mucilaginibacter limnophilus]RVT98066.1 membrane protein insertase YidC [Mucilaginibacter limnophilus]